MKSLLFNLKNKNILSTIVSFALVIFLVVLFGKLVVYDCVIGTKVYDENDIVIRYHRFVNIFTVKNNSDDKIYMHYHSGRCRLDANLDKRKYDIKYYKKYEDYKIKVDAKFIKFTGLFDDGYLFTVSNEKDLYDSVSYNKHKWFWIILQKLYYKYWT